MIKKIAWNTFKNTGDINTFLELKQIQNMEAQMHSINPMMNEIGGMQAIQMSQEILQQMEAQNGNNQNEWYNNF